MTRTIPLSKGCEAIVDDADFALVSQWKWHAYEARNTVYAVRTGPRDANGKREHFFMHRVILGMGRWEGVGSPEADHRNRNGLDNRRANLRIVTHRDNAYNRRNNRRPVACPECGQQFLPKHKGSIYCSLSCSGTATARSRPAGSCSIEGCDLPHLALGWCRMHYERIKKTGDLGPVGRLRARSYRAGLR